MGFAMDCADSTSSDSTGPFAVERVKVAAPMSGNPVGWNVLPISGASSTS